MKPAGSSAETSLERLARGTGRDLRTLQIKLTYIGPQLKYRPSAVFSTFEHLIDMGWFVPLRQETHSYANDEGDLWSFTVTEDEMVRITRSLRDVEAARGMNNSGTAHTSLMFALKRSRLGDTASEFILDATGSASVHGVIREALDQSNGIGRAVMEMHQSIM